MAALHSDGNVHTLTQPPGCGLLLAGLFLAGGLIGVAAAFVGRHEDGSAPSVGVRLASAAIGLAVGAAGAAAAAGSPLVRTEIDPTAGEVRVIRTGIFGRRSEVWPLAGLAAVVLERQVDDDGDAMHRVALGWQDGRRLVPSPVWRHHTGPAEDARALAVALGVPVEPGKPR